MAYTVSEKNTRILITISKETKSKLEEYAVRENRSMNNMLITLLNYGISEYERKNKED